MYSVLLNGSVCRCYVTVSKTDDQMTGHVCVTSAQSIHYMYWVATCVDYLWFAECGPQAEAFSCTCCRWWFVLKNIRWQSSKIVVLGAGLHPAVVTVVIIIIIYCIW